jgi:hypothetical protein
VTRVYIVEIQNMYSIGIDNCQKCTRTFLKLVDDGLRSLHNAAQSEGSSTDVPSLGGASDVEEARQTNCIANFYGSVIVLGLRHA